MKKRHSEVQIVYPLKRMESGLGVSLEWGLDQQTL